MAKKAEPLHATVLIIKDDPRNAVLLKFWLEANGYRCIIVESEEESTRMSDMKHLVGIFYASEFRFEFLNGKLEACHIYEDSDRVRSRRLRESTLIG